MNDIIWNLTDAEWWGTSRGGGTMGYLYGYGDGDTYGNAAGFYYGDGDRYGQIDGDYRGHGYLHSLGNGPYHGNGHDGGYKI